MKETRFESHRMPCPLGEPTPGATRFEAWPFLVADSTLVVAPKSAKGWSPERSAELLHMTLADRRPTGPGEFVYATNGRVNVAYQVSDAQVVGFVLTESVDSPGFRAEDLARAREQVAPPLRRHASGAKLRRAPVASKRMEVVAAQAVPQAVVSRA